MATLLQSYSAQRLRDCGCSENELPLADTQASCGGHPIWLTWPVIGEELQRVRRPNGFLFRILN